MIIFLQTGSTAIYSEDQLCGDLLKMTFLKNGKVVVHEAACAEF
jgi:hypothetical protein